MTSPNQYEAIRRYVTRLLGDPSSAQDITQDTFLRLEKQSPPPENLRAWLYQTARNLVIDQFRRNSRLSQKDIPLETLPDEATRCNPAAIAAQKEETQMLQEKLDSLPPRQREAVRLKFQEGLSYNEIATVMNETVTTVGYLLHDAITRLRKMMA